LSVTGDKSTGSAGARCDQPSFPHHHRRQRRGAERRGQMGGRHLKQPARAVSTAARTAARRGLPASGRYVVTDGHESMQCLFGPGSRASATSAERAISSVGHQRRETSSGSEDARHTWCSPRRFTGSRCRSAAQSRTLGSMSRRVRKNPGRRAAPASRILAKSVTEPRLASFPRSIGASCVPCSAR